MSKAFMPTVNHERVCYPRCIDGEKVRSIEHAYSKGKKAHSRRKLPDQSPYMYKSTLWHAWYQGWQDAEDECPMELWAEPPRTA